MIEPLWLNLARKEIGTKETPGSGDNPVVLKYAVDAELDGIINKDEVPWCAAFVGAMLARANIPGTKRANARSYETWGVRLNGPVLGCITILSRPPSTWQGHVGFLIGASATKVQLIGGNQGDRVSIETFPRWRVVGFRWEPVGLIRPGWVLPPIPSAAPANESTA